MALSDTLMDLVKDDKLLDKMAEDLFHSFGVKLCFERATKDNYKA